jgi:hypothetical protein
MVCLFPSVVQEAWPVKPNTTPPLADGRNLKYLDYIAGMFVLIVILKFLYFQNSCCFDVGSLYPLYVPQRHRFPSIACSMAVSDAYFFKKAAAVMDQFDTHIVTAVFIVILQCPNPKPVHQISIYNATQPKARTTNTRLSCSTHNTVYPDLPHRAVHTFN